MKEIIEAKLKNSLNECEKHLLRIKHAYNKMNSFFPLTVEKYENLNEEEIEHIDQYLYRFTKLQDSLGQRLFKNVLLSLGEEVDNKSFIDIFNRLDQLGIISDYDKWLTLRIIRNDIAHEYEEDIYENSQKLNKMFQMKDELCRYYISVREYLDRRKK